MGRACLGAIFLSLFCLSLKFLWDLMPPWPSRIAHRAQNLKAQYKWLGSSCPIRGVCPFVVPFRKQAELWQLEPWVGLNWSCFCQETEKRLCPKGEVGRDHLGRTYHIQSSVCSALSHLQDCNTYNNNSVVKLLCSLWVLELSYWMIVIQ